MGDDPKPEVVLERAQRGGRIGPELLVELEVADALVPGLRGAVGREEDQRVARQLLVADGLGQVDDVLGLLEESGRLEETERPARRQGREAGQLGVRLQDVGGVGPPRMYRSNEGASAS